YTILQKDGRDVGGLYRQMKEHEAEGIPPNWIPYVTVDNVDEAREKAVQLGAEGGPEPFDVMEMGRMAMLRDPVGAFIALWQPKKHIGAGVVNEYGTLCWNELQTPDRDSAQQFYTALFGWSAKVSPEYVEFHRPDGAAGGMRDFEHGPGHWLSYFAVNDADAAVRTAEGLGGGVLMPLMDIPNVGRMAVLRDPQGAAFAVIKLSMSS
ncbi:MAG TPA: VOC family protein, partial [Thermoanaerobaculia bacterium]|nr:VOC family protein [Thermoanaerobaculia bacterium]